MNPAVLATFVVYLLGMLFIGVLFYRKAGDLSDYILGGRRLGPLVAALSVGASDMSGWLLLGLPGAVYASGLSQIWIAIGLTIGAYLNWQFLAPKLRTFTERADNSLTISDFIEFRFQDRAHWLRLISAIAIMLFFGIYTAAGLVGGAVLFKNTFGVDYQTALWIGALVIISYTFLGGFLAVCWTDFFQGALMLFALLLVPMFVMVSLGGVSETFSQVASRKVDYVNAMAGLGPLSIASLMAWGLGYFGQPHILARFMAVKDQHEIPRARLVAMLWMILCLYGAIFVGFSGIAYFTDPLKNPETVFIQTVQKLFPAVIEGVLLAAILAAIMSTVDSQLLVSASVISEDLYRRLLKPSATEKEQLWVGRVSVLVVALFALWIASDPQSRVLSIVADTWAVLGASFGPVLLFALYWHKTTKAGALAGIITGAVTVIVWKNLSGGIFDLYELLPAFVLSSVAIVMVSFFTEDPEAERTFHRLKNNATQS